MFLSQEDQEKLSRKIEISQILNSFYPEYFDKSSSGFTSENKLVRTNNLNRLFESNFSTNNNVIMKESFIQLNNLIKEQQFKFYFEYFRKLIVDFITSIEKENKFNYTKNTSNDSSLNNTTTNIGNDSYFNYSTYSNKQSLSDTQYNFVQNLSSITTGNSEAEKLVSRINMLFYSRNITFETYTKLLKLVKAVEEEEIYYLKKSIGSYPNTYIGEVFYSKVNETFTHFSEKYFEKKSKELVNTLIETLINYDGKYYSLYGHKYDL